MTWSYTDPSASAKDEVRFLVGDTNQASPLVSDEEIQYALTKQGKAVSAAALICRTIAAKFARNVSTGVSGLSFANQQKFEQYSRLAVELEARAAMYVSPIVGGMKETEREEYRGDPDAVKPAFERDMHDYAKQPDDEDLRR